MAVRLDLIVFVRIVLSNIKMKEISNVKIIVRVFLKTFFVVKYLRNILQIFNYLLYNGANEVIP